MENKTPIEEIIKLNNKLKEIIKEKLNISKEKTVDSDNLKENTDTQNTLKEESKNKETSAINEKYNSLKKFVISEINKINKIVKKLKTSKEKEENKEKEVVEKAKPVYLESFGEKALLELNEIFQKVFNIKIVQPKDQTTKKSKLWLVALIAIVAVIIAKFNDIKKYILSIDWNKIWGTIRNYIVEFLADLPFKIIDAIVDAFNLIKDVILKIFEKEEFQKLIENIKKTLIPTDFINNIKNSIVEFFTKTIPDIFKKVTDKVKSFVNKIFSAINDFLGFKFFDTGKDDKDKTDAINAEEKIDELNSQSSQTEGSSGESPSSEPAKEEKPVEPNIIVANNLNKFNNIKGGAIDKSFVVNDNKEITMTPLHPNDSVAVLKEDGIIDKRLNEVINSVNTQTAAYSKQFEDINNEIIKQNDILTNYNKNKITKEHIINNDKAMVKYVQNNVNRLQTEITNNKQPQIATSSINDLRLQYLNG